MSEIRNLLAEAVDAWPAFDDPDEPVNGGDLVEWFSEWRERAKAALKAGDAPEDLESGENTY